MVLTDQMKRVRKDVQKMPSLPKNAKVRKRPLMHPPISSRYAGKGSEKVVYVSSKTPFMSAFKRVMQLLNQINKRVMQSELARQKKLRTKGSASSPSPARNSEPEPVIVKATGKAIDKALSLALLLQKQNNLEVNIMTSTADAIDDIIPCDEPPSHMSDAVGNDLSEGVGSLNADASMADASEIEPGSLNGATIAQALPESRLRRTSAIRVLVTMP